MPNISSITSYVEPVPIAPTLPDFGFCHSDYGVGLRRQDAMYAGGILPIGTGPLDYSVTQDEAGGKAWLNELPYDVSFGGITITVEVAGPVDIRKMSLVPNRIRGMAAFLANSCVGARGIGGFITHRIRGMVDYVTDPTADLDAPAYPNSAAFITLTMSSPQHAHTYPGDYDPIVAKFLQRVETHALERSASPFVKAEITDRIVRYMFQAQRMRRLGTVSWWSYLGNGNATLFHNQLQVPQRVNGTTVDAATSRRRKRSQIR